MALLRTHHLVLVSAFLLAPAQAEPDNFREVFPHVRIDAEARTVEIDASVPILADDPDAPNVYLELLVCTPNTREHETLLVTPARPSNIHAALLLLGLEPGKPGAWDWNEGALTSTPPTGPPLDIRFVYTDDAGVEHADHPSTWIRAHNAGEPFPVGSWLFAGSRIVTHNNQEFYDADGTGVVMGLTAFGSEIIAWPAMISPEANVNDPLWTANPDTVPPLDTNVTIRISPAAKMPAAK